MASKTDSPYILYVKNSLDETVIYRQNINFDIFIIYQVQQTILMTIKLEGYSDQNEWDKMVKTKLKPLRIIVPPPP